MLNVINISIQQGLVLLNNAEESVWASYPNLSNALEKLKVMSAEDAKTAPKVSLFSRKPLELTTFNRVKKRLIKEGIPEQKHLYNHPKLSRKDITNKGNILVNLTDAPKEVEVLFGLIALHLAKREDVKQSIKSLALLREVKADAKKLATKFSLKQSMSELSKLDDAFEYQESYHQFKYNLIKLIEVYVKCVDSCLGKVQKLDSYVASGRPLTSLA